MLGRENEQCKGNRIECWWHRINSVGEIKIEQCWGDRMNRVGKIE